MTILHAPLTCLSGIGELYQKKLAKLQIFNLFDLLTFAPRGYESREGPKKIANLIPGTSARVVGTVISTKILYARSNILNVLIEDETGTLNLKFFRFYPNQIKLFSAGKPLTCFGEIKRFGSTLEITHPEYSFDLEDEVAHPDGPQILPLYPLSEGLNQKRLHNYMERALQKLDHCDDVELELLPPDLSNIGLCSFRAAITFLHQPTDGLDQLNLGYHFSQIRLSFEELLAHRLALLSAQKQKISPAKAMPLPQARIQAFLKHLPFELTSAQINALQEIAADMNQSTAMQRLLQGDVGAGKTIVALLSALIAIDAGYQVALMAPTELLAEQLFLKAQELEGVSVRWLGGNLSKKAKSKVYENLQSGECSFVVGTHALIQEGVQFKNLGLVIIDEQHRFGVIQRLSLQQKNQANFTPHQLIMTATPIPRTLAMTLYAELKMTSIQELPKGRKPIKTALISELKRDQIIQRLNQAQEQAYWICPLIEESELLDAKAAETTFESLQAECPTLRIGLLHGRMKGETKSQIMQAFKAGEIDVLVATTVVEVGVDAPNASIIIIENPERMGLSQLHQLRGRVGRGQKESACILLYQAPLSATAQARLTALRDSQDGFYLADKDLELRGPGEFLGTKQKGSVHFRFASLMRDQNLLPQIKMLADRMLTAYPAETQKLIQRWFGKNSELIKA
ncbi:MAG: ATP-dependent DNA helicase RecG [Gammaproteobacteria bacterium]|nr:ATP-dependent DNA helicase RecG [Gammaproteobacteria bacterium]